MKQHKVPDILIEQYALGELSEDKVRMVESSPGFEERLAEIRRSDQEILAKYPAERFAARIENQIAAQTIRETDKAQASQGRRVKNTAVRWLAFGVPGAAAIVVGAILAVQAFIGSGLAGGDQGLDDVVRLKGDGPELSVYRSVNGPDTQDEEAEELVDGTSAAPGDRLQLAYNSGDRQYGAIISVDGRGAVFVHFPYALSGEPRLVPGRTQRLAVGYQLDDAPRFEHFYFITAEDSFPVQQLVQNIRGQANQITERADSLRLSNEFEITSFTIYKGE